MLELFSKRKHNYLFNASTDFVVSNTATFPKAFCSKKKPQMHVNMGLTES